MIPCAENLNDLTVQAERKDLLILQSFVWVKTTFRYLIILSLNDTKKL